LTNKKILGKKMLIKINKEIDDFTKNIKEEKGCDEMLDYLNSSYISTIKLLMFASKTFSLYARLMFFLVMASGALLLSSIIGALPISLILISVSTVLSFVLILLFITKYREILSDSIINTKKSRE
jgi:hypothetical protein